MESPIPEEADYWGHIYSWGAWKLRTSIFPRSLTTEDSHILKEPDFWGLTYSQGAWQLLSSHIKGFWSPPFVRSGVDQKPLMWEDGLLRTNLFPGSPTTEDIPIPWEPDYRGHTYSWGAQEEEHKGVVLIIPAILLAPNCYKIKQMINNISTCILGLCNNIGIPL